MSKKLTADLSVGLKVEQLKQTEHWEYIADMLKDRYRKYHNVLETAPIDDILDLQGRIAELKEIFSWFDAKIEEAKLEKLAQEVEETQVDEF